MADYLIELHEAVEASYSELDLGVKGGETVIYRNYLADDIRKVPV